MNFPYDTQNIISEIRITSYTSLMLLSVPTNQDIEPFTQGTSPSQQIPHKEQPAQEDHCREGGTVSQARFSIHP